ncbi:MAG: leucine-rich repeat protein [Ruminococcus sp.]|nr:leucine-rich repeat protein [Ruminococcus sp.]
MPKSVKTINGGCFYSCNKLKSVKFDRNKSMCIWDYCFMDCKKLKYAEYPVLKNKYCGEGIFDECPTLKKIKVKAELKSFRGLLTAIKPLRK